MGCCKKYLPLTGRTRARSVISPAMVNDRSQQFYVAWYFCFFKEILHIRAGLKRNYKWTIRLGLQHPRQQKCGGFQAKYAVHILLVALLFGVLEQRLFRQRVALRNRKLPQVLVLRQKHLQVTEREGISAVLTWFG